MTEPGNFPPNIPPEPVGYAGPGMPVIPSSPDDKSMAMLAHLLGIFTGFLGPLIIWLIKKDQSPFVNDQGKEALNFQIFAIICFFGCFLTFCVPPVAVLLVATVQIGRIVLSIIGTVNANKGIAYRYPVNLRLVK